MYSLRYKYLYRISGGYGETVRELEDGSCLIMLNTRGMEYDTEFITEFITEFRDTRWFCVEENEIEEAFFFQNGKGVEIETRKLESIKA